MISSPGYEVPVLKNGVSDVRNASAARNKWIPLLGNDQSDARKMDLDQGCAVFDWRSSMNDSGQLSARTSAEEQGFRGILGRKHRQNGDR